MQGSNRDFARMPCEGLQGGWRRSHGGQGEGKGEEARKGHESRGKQTGFKEAARRQQGGRKQFARRLQGGCKGAASRLQGGCKEAVTSGNTASDASKWTHPGHPLHIKFHLFLKPSQSNDF